MTRAGPPSWPASGSGNRQDVSDMATVTVANSSESVSMTVSECAGRTAPASCIVGVAGDRHAKPSGSAHTVGLCQTSTVVSSTTELGGRTSETVNVLLSMKSPTCWAGSVVQNLPVVS